MIEALTENERLFCEVFDRNKNAAQAYVRVYGCAYDSAMLSACETPTKPNIKTYLKYCELSPLLYLTVF